MRIAFRFVTVLLAAAMSAPCATASQASKLDQPATRIAYEARQVIEMIEWFYVQHRACPQPAHASELHAMEGGLGDGYSVEQRGWFLLIRGISMPAPWRYHVNPRHPDRCTLWRELGPAETVVWSRSGGSTRWAVVP